MVLILCFKTVSLYLNAASMNRIARIPVDENGRVPPPRERLFRRGRIDAKSLMEGLVRAREQVDLSERTRNELSDSALEILLT